MRLANLKAPWFFLSYAIWAIPVLPVLGSTWGKRMKRAGSVVAWKDAICCGVGVPNTANYVR